MSFINYSSREINCKVVYYGPGLCGKTTNLQYIHKRMTPESRGKMISLATETERTLFFDFLPLALGEIRGFKTRFHLYTVPGQVFYDASRKLTGTFQRRVVEFPGEDESRTLAMEEDMSVIDLKPRGSAKTAAAAAGLRPLPWHALAVGIAAGLGGSGRSQACTPGSPRR